MTLHAEGRKGRGQDTTGTFKDNPTGTEGSQEPKEKKKTPGF